MKSDANTPTGLTPGHTRGCVRPVALSLGFLMPFLMGGCPEFRNELVSVIETATRSALLGTDDVQSIADTAAASLVDASINLFFDQLRADQIN